MLFKATHIWKGYCPVMEVGKRKDGKLTAMDGCGIYLTAPVEDFEPIENTLTESNKNG